MDYSSSRSVPFEIPNVNHGFQVAKGLMKLRENGIELEFEVQDAFLGITSSGLKTVALPYDKLQSIRYEKGWFSARVILEATSMRVFDKVPGTEQANCTLKIKRKHREEAEHLVSKARLQFSEYKLNKMEERDDET